MILIQGLIVIHVGAGMAWLVVSSIALVGRAAGRWIMALQTAASLATLLAGIVLWHALHTGGMGPVERSLVVGTFCALTALGLQAGVVAAREPGRMSTGRFALHAVSVGFLAAAAVAMVASRFAS